MMVACLKLHDSRRLCVSRFWGSSENGSVYSSRKNYDLSKSIISHECWKIWKSYMCTSISGLYVRMTSTTPRSTLVIACVSCMHIVSFLWKYTSRGMHMLILLLKACVIGNSIIFFQFLPSNNLLWNVHVSTL